MKRTFAMSGMVGLCLIAVPGRPLAQRAITLDEAVALAQRNAPSVVQARGQSRTSGAGVKAAYSAFLPNVTVSATASRQYGGGQRVENGQVVSTGFPWSSSAGLDANVEIFSGGQRLFDIREARARRRAAGANEVAQQFNAALEAKRRYYDVLAARESQGAAAAQLAQAEQQRRTSVARTRARVATRSDSLRAEIQYREAALAVTDARNALEQANASLTRVTGSPDLVTAAPVDTTLLPTLAADEATLRALAQNGPAVAQAKAELDAARAAQKGAWTDYLPALNASYSRTGRGSSSSPEFVDENFAYTGSLRFSLSLPVFNQWQREERLTQAKVAEDNAEAAMRDAQLTALESLTTQLGTFRSAEERVASQIATVDAAEEDLRVQEQRYAAGASTLLDVLTSQTQLNQARRDLIRARYDLRVAKAELEAIVGRGL